jgi:hypothetical protein
MRSLVHGERPSCWEPAPRAPSRSLLLALEAERDPAQRTARAPLVRRRPLSVIALVR